MADTMLLLDSGTPELWSAFSSLVRSFRWVNEDNANLGRNLFTDIPRTFSFQQSCPSSLLRDVSLDAEKVNLVSFERFGSSHKESAPIHREITENEVYRHVEYGSKIR